MKTKTVSPTRSTHNTFLSIAIHHSPRQPGQSPPLLLDNPRRRTPATSATLESRRRWRRCPRIRGNRVAIQIRHDRAHVASAPASAEEPRESDVRCGFSGVSSPRGTAVEELRAEAERGEDEFDSERTRGLPLRPGVGRGEPLLRRLAVGVGGETLTGATAGTGTADPSSDSGGGEVKAGLGGTSSSSGGGDSKAGRAGTSASAARAAGTGTGAANGGGGGVGVGFSTSSGGEGGT